ncbi:uncharacterized protein LOC122794104 [Protopterus annectens]|uniref:uncharacterized protein LOC122794104 n=1 Tax=Protopterus annectens TaxID=7888 RepID=UPI001CFB5179|nr:uncharacterized protein LOC122794104 [Protopterus annectens]
MGRQSIYNYCIIAGILITSLQHVTAKGEDKLTNQSTTFSSEFTSKTSPTVSIDYSSPEDITNTSTAALKNVSDNAKKELQETSTTETLFTLSTDITGTVTNSEEETESPIPGLTSPASAGTMSENEIPLITTSVTTTSAADGDTTPAEQKSDYSWIVIIVIVVLIAAILAILIICLVKNKDRRYSFDLYHKSPEDAGIPLNAVEREGTVEQISADAKKDEKAVDNDTKPSKDSAATGGMVQAEKLGAAPADIEIPLDNADESNQKKEHDQCSLDLSEASLLTDLENVTNSKKAKTADDDGISTHSAKTSQETLQDTQNDNNNNNSNVIVVGLQKGRLRKDLCSFPDDNPDFMVMTYRKNDSKQCSISEERQVMDYMPCTPCDTANQNDDIICIRITQKDNIEEGKRNWSLGQAGFSQDSAFTEVQLNQFEFGL